MKDEIVMGSFCNWLFKVFGLLCLCGLIWILFETAIYLHHFRPIKEWREGVDSRIEYLKESKVSLKEFPHRHKGIYGGVKEE